MNPETLPAPPWPAKLPPWFWRFAWWCDRGRIPAERPYGIPADLTPYKAWLWERYRVHRGVSLMTVGYSCRPPIAFYRVPDDATLGPTEFLPALAQIGFRGIGVDPLAGDFSSWLPILRANMLELHVWSRGGGYTRAKHTELQSAAGKLKAVMTFPNIEDDDLRAFGSTIEEDLAYCGLELDGAPVGGILTNYFTNELWKNSPLSHLTVFPEIQPREYPAAKDVQGCINRALLFFDTALPLLDGRESGRAFFKWFGAYGGIWPADPIAKVGPWK